MAEQSGNQTIRSTCEQQKSVRVVTVESFYTSHAEKLQMKVDGLRVGFHRKIREPTINRPGLALSGFYAYFAEKRIQVLGAAELSYLKSLPADELRERVRTLCSTRIPCLVIARHAHPSKQLVAEAHNAGITIV